MDSTSKAEKKKKNTHKMPVYALCVHCSIWLSILSISIHRMIFEWTIGKSSCLRIQFAYKAYYVWATSTGYFHHHGSKSSIQAKHNSIRFALLLCYASCIEMVCPAYYYMCDVCEMLSNACIVSCMWYLTTIFRLTAHFMRMRGRAQDTHTRTSYSTGREQSWPNCWNCSSECFKK